MAAKLTPDDLADFAAYAGIDTADVDVALVEELVARGFNGDPLATEYAKRKASENAAGVQRRLARLARRLRVLEASEDAVWAEVADVKEANPGITYDDLAEALGRSRSTIQRRVVR